MKKVRFLAVAVIMLMMLFPQISTGSPLAINILSTPVPGYVIDENNGIYVLLLREIEKRENLKIKILIRPALRAVKYFHEQKGDAFMPGLDAMFQPDQLPLRTNISIGTKTETIITLMHSRHFRTIKELEGKKVGLMRGYPYAKEITNNKRIIFDVVNSMESNLKKLLKGRIDAIIADPGIVACSINGGILGKQVYFDPNLEIGSQDIYIAFQPSEKGKKLKALFDKALLKMEQDGSLTRIIGD